MATVIYSFFLILAVFVSSFVFWRKLKEDYSYNDTFKFTLLAVAGSMIGQWLGNKWAPNFIFWITVCGMFLASLYSIKKFSFKFYEVIDAGSLAFFWFLLFSNLAPLSSFLVSPTTDLKFLLIKIALILISMFIYKFLLKNYRKFSWYPSGRIGFVGMASLAVYLSFYALFSVLTSGFKDVLSDGAINAIIAVSLTSILGFGIYKRAGILR